MERTRWAGQTTMKRRKTMVPVGLICIPLLLVSAIGMTLPGCKGSSRKATSRGESEVSITEYWKSLFEKDPEARQEFERVQSEFRAGNPSTAIMDLQELLKRSPQAPWLEAGEFYLAQAWTVLRRYGEAIRQLDSLLVRYPKSPAVPRFLMSKGEIYLTLGKQNKEANAEDPASKEYLQKAKEIFQQISKDYPKNRDVDAEAFFYLGETLSSLEDLTRAKEAYRRVVDTYGDTAYGSKALYSLAGLCLSDMDIKGAEGALQEIADRYPEASLADKAGQKLEGLQLVGSPAPPLQIREWIGDPPPEGGLYRSKVTLLSFWAIWCPHCRRNIPRMERLLETYGKQGVSIVGVTRERNGKGVGEIREFIDSHPMGFSTGVDNDGKTSKEMAVQSIPCVVAVDSHGRIRWHGHPDYLSDKVIETLLQTSS